MFTIFGIAKTKKNLVKMGTTKTDAEWFFISPEIIKKLGGGDLVGKKIETYESKWNKELRGQLVEKITISKGTEPEQTKKPVTEKINQEINKQSNKIKSSNNLEIAKTTAQTMKSLQGFVDPNNVASVIEIIYNTYKKLIG